MCSCCYILVREGTSKATKKGKCFLSKSTTTHQTKPLDKTMQTKSPNNYVALTSRVHPVDPRKYR